MSGSRIHRKGGSRWACLHGSRLEAGHELAKRGDGYLDSRHGKKIKTVPKQSEKSVTDMFCV